jgi:hypothetical protein
MKCPLICSDSHTPYNRVTSKASQNLHAIPLAGISISKLNFPIQRAKEMNLESIRDTQAYAALVRGH